jgi:thymidylate synthase (FAD)
MNKIQVKVINESSVAPGDMMGFLARLTQRGHHIKNMQDLLDLYNRQVPYELKSKLADMPHGTIKRFTPITVAIVGASRRFLAQARTHQVGVTYVSASLQYSDYSGQADFVVPYELLKENGPMKHKYLESCKASMKTYMEIVGNHISNDTAGYAAPQGLRNILIMQGNHEFWSYFIRRRGCNRNTAETQYVTMLIWRELLNTKDGQIMFGDCGPDCMYGRCKEGALTCGNDDLFQAKRQFCREELPEQIMRFKWPLLYK